jgi:hypothetical protein
MEALLASLVSKYGFDVAAKMLGIEKQQQNPKYAISLGNINLNPMNMIQRAGLNQGIKSLMGGNMSSLMGPAALLGGAVMLGRTFDPTRLGSRNYNPYLSEQIDYLGTRDNFIGRNPSSGLMQYGPGSVLRGQNVVSMFGTNDYRNQLEKKKDYFENRISKGKNYSQTQYEKTLKEIDDFERAETNKEMAKEKKARDQVTRNLMTQNTAYTGGGGGGGDGGGGNISGSISRGGTDDTPGTPFRRGGIASL